MTVLAHSGQPPAPHDLWGAWAWEPAVVLGVLAAVWCYRRGRRRLWASAGTGQAVSGRRSVAFHIGVGVAALALLSPLDAASQALASAHMVQHLLLALVAAPLVVLGAPARVMAYALPPGPRRGLGRVTGTLRRTGRRAPLLPAAALAAYAGVWWAWHLPALYDAAVRSTALHAVEHMTLLAAALALWWPVAGWRRTPAWGGLLLLLGAAIQGGILATLLTFAPRAWYGYATATAAWGLSPLEDQQLAGVIMWVPGGMLYLLAAAVLFVRWLDEDERRQRRRADAARVPALTAAPVPSSNGLEGARDGA